MSNAKAYRGSIFYFKDSATLENLPAEKDLQTHDHQYVYHEDGVLIVEAGKITDVGIYNDMKEKLNGIPVIHYKNKIITPGFIDTHQHATQSAIVAAYGSKLLQWLENYVFPAESKYVDDTAAKKDLNFFLNQLIKNGTTTAVSYGPLFLSASNIFFEELQKT